LIYIRPWFNAFKTFKSFKAIPDSSQRLERFERSVAIERLAPRIRQRRDFHQTEKTIDILPVRRYCSGQKKRWFKIPIQHVVRRVQSTGLKLAQQECDAERAMTRSKTGRTGQWPTVYRGFSG